MLEERYLPCHRNYIEGVPWRCSSQADRSCKVVPIRWERCWVRGSLINLRPVKLALLRRSATSSTVVRSEIPPDHLGRLVDLSRLSNMVRQIGARCIESEESSRSQYIDRVCSCALSWWGQLAVRVPAANAEKPCCLGLTRVIDRSQEYSQQSGTSGRPTASRSARMGCWVFDSNACACANAAGDRSATLQLCRGMDRVHCGMSIARSISATPCDQNRGVAAVGGVMVVRARNRYSCQGEFGVGVTVEVLEKTRATPKVLGPPRRWSSNTLPSTTPPPYPLTYPASLPRRIIPPRRWPSGSITARMSSCEPQEHRDDGRQFARRRAKIDPAATAAGCPQQHHRGVFARPVYTSCGPERHAQAQQGQQDTTGREA
ncbi:hypothetical protein FB567DRAFT_554527 [Paraphoma chrysanthemicola]|uniref:Uncharacterized protein n=1 Tax=Paraphoma chrysanthemicola TaxID=798071 RepID=A0A8K0QU11_9PLEO|nr:hypothetical protein FB567DRAFT_554527 [Paraphoma chrysanthemicola]